MNQIRSFTLQSDKDIISKESPTERAFRVAFNAAAATKKVERPALNLALIIDRSGSMSGGKLAYALRAAAYVVSTLRETDHVAVVSFDDKVQIECPSMPATATNKQIMLDQIRRIREGGSTNLSGGWLTGCQLVAGTQKPEQLCRAILLTDGEANAGITDINQLAEHAREISARGISTSTFGIGLGFNEHLLEAISNNGKGNFHYIADEREIPALFARELGELTEILLRNVTVRLDVPNTYKMRVLGGFLFDQGADGSVTVRLNDIYAEQVGELFITALIAPQADGSSLGCTATLQATSTEGEALSQKAEHILTYASAQEELIAPLSAEVMARYADLYLADVVKECLEMERRGQGAQAQSRLQMELIRLQAFLPEDRVMFYRQTAMRLGAYDLREDERKTFHSMQYTIKKSRLD